MAPTRPSAATAADHGVDRARASGGGGRLATIADDFLLDPARRLTEQERALMTAMLLGLVGTLADEIRVRLRDHEAQACEHLPHRLLEDLRSAGLLRHGPLLGLLLRRAEEVAIAEAAGGASSPLQGWTADEVPAVAAAAMALVLARAAARDRFGRPGLELGDCDAETAVHLGYAVAAVLAARAPGVEEQIVAATVDLLGRHDEGQRLHVLHAKLVIALEAAGRLDGELVARLAAAGEAGLVAQALGRLSGINGDAAWDLLLSSEPGGTALLLRMAGVQRSTAARVLAALAITPVRMDPLLEIDRFEQLADEKVAQRRARLRLPPHFQAAVNALAAVRG